MEDKKFLVKFINDCRSRINAALTIDNVLSAAIIGAAFGLLFEVAAFLRPFYYADLFAVLAVVIGAITGLIISIVKRIGMKEAALKIDSLGFKERIITAYENLDKEDDIYLAQRKNACSILKKNQSKVRFKIISSPRKIMIIMGVLAALVCLSFVPSKVKTKAEEEHKIHELAKEEKDEIKEAIDALEEIDEENLSESERAEINSMLESLNASITEYNQAESMEALSNAEEKINYKYDKINQSLSDMANANPDNLSKQSILNAANIMSQNMLNNNKNGESLANQTASNNGSKGDSNNSSNNSSNENNGDSQGESQQGNNGDSQGESQQGNNGDSQGESQQENNGDSQGGSQQGNDGQSEENENGNSNSEGSSSGNGRGEGSGSTDSYDYVSVPNQYGNDDNLIGEAGNSDNSQYYQSNNGLGWEGNHVSYDSVIGNYSNQAYEGVEQGKYPSGMEDVIRDYFGSFND